LRDTVLLQEVVLVVSSCRFQQKDSANLEHLCDFERDLVALSQSTLSDKLDNLGQILLLLQDLLCGRSQLDETGVDFFVMGIEDLEVLGVGQAGRQLGPQHVVSL